MLFQLFLPGFLVLAVAFTISFFATEYIRKLAISWNIVDLPDNRRVHTEPIPRLGGIAILFGFLFGLIVLINFSTFNSNLQLNSPNTLYGFVLGALMVCLIGVMDDLRHVRAVYKLFGQFAVGVIMFASNLRFGAVLFPELPLVIDFVLSVLFVATVINAFNLIDGLDGLATGLASISALGLMGMFILNGMVFEALIALCIIGSCLGFLFYNYNPAKIFLGDSGSMLLGYLIASFVLFGARGASSYLHITTALIMLSIPLLDVALAVWRRTVRKLAPALTKASQGGVMCADRDHLHHRLISNSRGQREVTCRLYLASCILVFIGLLAVQYPNLQLPLLLSLALLGSYVVLRHIAVMELSETVQILSIHFARYTNSTNSRYRNLSKIENVLIDGTGSQCRDFLSRTCNALNTRTERLQRIVGIIDDRLDVELGEAQEIYGHKVLGHLSDALDLISAYSINKIIIAADMSIECQNELFEMLGENSVRVVNYFDPNKVTDEDLIIEDPSLKTSVQYGAGASLVS